MTKEQRKIFFDWAKNEANGAVLLEGDGKDEFNHRIRAGFDLMRHLFPHDVDWLDTIWEQLMH